MRRTILCLVLGIALLACRKEQPAQPQPAKTETVAQTVIIPEDMKDARIDITLPLLPNAVAQCGPTKNEFASGEDIPLAMVLNEAPDGLVVAARLKDSAGEFHGYTTTPAAGLRNATVTIKEKLPAGRYMLEGYWGGNLVCDHEIAIK